MHPLVLETWHNFDTCGLVRADLDQHMLCVAFLRGINAYEQGAFVTDAASKFERVLAYMNKEIWPMLVAGQTLMNRFKLNQYYALIYGRRLGINAYQMKHIQIDFHFDENNPIDYENWRVSFTPLTPATIRMKEERDRLDREAAAKIERVKGTGGILG